MTISQLDESGKPVDGWFLYKIPKLGKASGTPAETGYADVYYDEKVGKLTKSPNVPSSGKGALDLTSSAIFEGPSATTGWILYNDEMPPGADRKDNGALGHRRGFIAFDTASKTAIWLLHSWRKFEDPGVKGMPTPMSGQTYLCLALDLATASAIAKQMIDHQEAQTYLPHLPPSLSKSDPLYRLTQPLDPNAASESGAIDCKSRGCLPFKVIAKNRKWGKDFWNDLVGPTLEGGHGCRDVEPWPHRADARQRRDSQDVRHQVDRPSPLRHHMDLARQQRPREVGAHQRGKLDFRRRHEPDDFAGAARRRDDRVPRREALE
jgi:deoxyribonuclease-2